MKYFTILFALLSSAVFAHEMDAAECELYAGEMYVAAQHREYRTLDETFKHFQEGLKVCKTEKEGCIYQDEYDDKKLFQDLKYVYDHLKMSPQSIGDKFFTECLSKTGKGGPDLPRSM